MTWSFRLILVPIPVSGDGEAAAFESMMLRQWTSKEELQGMGRRT